MTYLLEPEDPVAVEELRARPALAFLDDAALVELAERAQFVSVAAGELLAGDGQAPQLIEDGVAWVLRHGRRVKQLGPGDLVTEVVNGRRPRVATIVAATPMRLIALEGLDHELVTAAAAQDGTSQNEISMRGRTSE